MRPAAQRRRGFSPGPKPRVYWQNVSLAEKRADQTSGFLLFGLAPLGRNDETFAA
jgi:hypothetical protein